MGNKITQLKNNTSTVTVEEENKDLENPHQPTIKNVTVKTPYYPSVEIFFVMLTLSIAPILREVGVSTYFTALIWTVSWMAIAIIYVLPWAMICICSLWKKEEAQ